MASFSLVEKFKPVLLYKGAANAVDCDYISCKNAHKVWFFISHAGANDTDLVLTVTEASDVAGTAAATVGKSCPIYSVVSTTSTDALTREATDGTAVTIDPATEGSQTIVIEWDPAKHAAGLDCITLADSGGHASNSVHIYAFVETRYPQAVPPTAITD